MTIVTNICKNLKLNFVALYNFSLVFLRKFLTLQGNNNRIFIKTLTFGNNWVIILTQFTEINNYISILIFKDINLLKQKVLINSQNFVFQKFKEFVKHLVPTFYQSLILNFFYLLKCHNPSKASILYLHFKFELKHLEISQKFCSSLSWFLMEDGRCLFPWKLCFKLK